MRLLVTPATLAALRQAGTAHRHERATDRDDLSRVRDQGGAELGDRRQLLPCGEDSLALDRHRPQIARAPAFHQRARVGRPLPCHADAYVALLEPLRDLLGEGDGIATARI